MVFRIQIVLLILLALPAIEEIFYHLLLNFFQEFYFSRSKAKNFLHRDWSTLTLFIKEIFRYDKKIKYTNFQIIILLNEDIDFVGNPFKSWALSNILFTISVNSSLIDLSLVSIYRIVI